MVTLNVSTVNQENRILCLLEAAWPNWTPAPELAKISLRYNARIFSLRRRKGWLIENRVRMEGRIRHGEFRLGSPAVPSNRDLRQRSVAPTAQGTSLFSNLPPQESHLDNVVLRVVLEKSKYACSGVATD
jgi:hypothetical protein